MVAAVLMVISSHNLIQRKKQTPQFVSFLRAWQTSELSKAGRVDGPLLGFVNEDSLSESLTHW